MKITRNSLLRAAALTLAASSYSHAASATWTGSGGANWATTGSWSASPVPGTGETATFSGAGNGNTTINTGTVTINTILFDSSGAAGYTLAGGQINLNDSGAITVNGSVTNNQVISSNVVLGTTSTTASYAFTNNSSAVGQLLTISGNIGSGASNTNNQTKTLALAGSANGLVSGLISGDGTGSGQSKTAVVGITKSGAGTWTLSNANTYSGTTSVTGGALLATNVSGSATGTGALSVEANGELGGTGTIAPSGTNGINVSGVLAPGTGIGNLTFSLGNTTGTVSMASGSKFEYELGLAGSDINAFGNSDLLKIAGAATSDFAFNNNTIDFLNTGSVGFYKLFDTSSDLANTWTGLTVSGTGLIEGGLTVANLTPGLTGKLIMGGNSFGGTTGDIYMQVIPEPAAGLLGGLGTLLLLRRRNR